MEGKKVKCVTLNSKFYSDEDFKVFKEKGLKEGFKVRWLKKYELDPGNYTYTDILSIDFKRIAIDEE